ncbi:DUF1707 domain-containing protein [Pseudonocardia xishanensis]|uniref:DUF1707 domain-containing protein n=1 Tax=Pseudonocardia xishanensis TaxID=630995 RepID=A0ABP8RJE6_9PSEU
MSTDHPTLRISDAERETVAVRIRDAAAEGRLTLEEADERQQAVYAARTAADLEPLTADLPAPPAPVPSRRAALTPEARRRLLVHAGIGAAFALLFLIRWVVGPVPFFWPAGPLFWIAASVVAHYLWTTRRRQPSAPGTTASR